MAPRWAMQVSSTPARLRRSRLCTLPSRLLSVAREPTMGRFSPCSSNGFQRCPSRVPVLSLRSESRRSARYEAVVKNKRPQPTRNSGDFDALQRASKVLTELRETKRDFEVKLRGECATFYFMKFHSSLGYCCRSLVAACGSTSAMTKTPRNGGSPLPPWCF